MPMWTCSTQMVLYVEPEYNTEINTFIQNNYDDICDAFNQIGYGFCYMERLWPQITEYYMPYFRKEKGSESPHDILRKLYVPTDCFPTSLCLYDIDESLEWFRPTYSIFCFEGYEGRIKQFIDDVIAYLAPKEEAQEESSGEPHIRYSRSELIPIPDDDYDADRHFSHDVYELMDEVKERIERLRMHGIAESILWGLLRSEARLSQMVITERGRIILPDYGNREIKMTPLVKAVYFLFLRHPEGIVFKHLPDYREELLRIYQHLTGRSSDEAIMQSIEDVTNPCKNSINEKCARIREAFVREFDDRLAVHYYVTGNRGQAKKIKLPRHKVEWR